MNITSLTPIFDNRPGKLKTLAHFDLQLSPDVRIYGMRLLEDSRGRRLSYPPSSGGRRFATFDSALAEAITNAAVKVYEDKGRVTANAYSQ